MLQVKIIEREIKYAKEELNQILENHKHWINEDCEDWEYMEADLRGKELNDLDLSGASLENTNLSKVMLI